MPSLGSRLIEFEKQQAAGGSTGGSANPGSTPLPPSLPTGFSPTAMAAVPLRLNGPDCAAALDRTARMSAAIGLKFNANARLALQALGTGVPARLRLSEQGMKIANDFVHANHGLLRDGKPYGPGLTSHQFNFGRGAYDYGTTVNGDPTPLGALLGRSTVILNADGDVVGIRDSFDYNPGNHTTPIKQGVAMANADITRNCKNRVPYVPITGGIVR